MIIIEHLQNGLISRRSDQNVYIRQRETGKEYIEAIDVLPCKYTYVETDKPIQSSADPPLDS